MFSVFDRTDFIDVLFGVNVLYSGEMMSFFIPRYSRGGNINIFVILYVTFLFFNSPSFENMNDRFMLKTGENRKIKVRQMPDFIVSY